jgi:hypothetical protein
MNELVNLKHLTPPAIKSHLNSHQMLCDNYRGKYVYMDMETHFMNYHYLGT